MATMGEETNFVISTDDERIVYLRSKDARLNKLVLKIGDIRCGRHENLFQFVVGEIIEQMLSIKVADILRDRFSALCEGDVCPEKVLALSVEQIRSIGVSKSKASFIHNYAQATADGVVCYDALSQLPDEEILKALTSIKGIGTWTAKMALIFVFERENILPYEDVAFLQGYKWLYNTSEVHKKFVIQKCKKWSPYASLAARYLYRAVDMGLTKSQFHLFKEWED